MNTYTEEKKEQQKKERLKILQMVEEKKITAAEAEKLFDALGQRHAGSADETACTNGMPRFLHVLVNSDKGDTVNIKIPLSLIRAGIKLTSLIPEHAHEKINTHMKTHGVDFDFRNLNEKNLSEIVEALRELEIDVNDKSETVRVYCA